MDLHSNRRLDPAGKIGQYFYNILSKLTNFFYIFLLFSTKK